MTIGDVILLLITGIIFSLILLLFAAIIRGQPENRKTAKHLFNGREASFADNDLTLGLFLIAVLVAIWAGYMIL
jgi:hypothetical protein